MDSSTMDDDDNNNNNGNALGTKASLGAADAQ